MMRVIAASRPEERFVELFQDVFGPAAAAKLESQVFFEDIFGKSRYIDFALTSLLDRFALEIDGETYHHPKVLTAEEYEDQLIRQNSLIHQGWRVLRWTDRQLAEKPNEVKEQLSILLEQAIRLAVPPDYLPPKRGSLIELHEHQQEALDNLRSIRATGDQIALLSHAVGTGKTTTAVTDALSLGLRTLFLAHTHELVEQAWNRFAYLWLEATRARLGDANDNNAQVVVGTVQKMSARLQDYEPKDFGYIVIDEAHHATSKSYRAVLAYFDPEFLLGLTGTPDRADGHNVLEVFQHAAHRMDMETAVKKGVLCDVRCFRVKTNVDLKRVKFNGSLYNQKDLEDSVTIPSRNKLIVDTYATNVPGRPAVVFCVSVNHAEKMAALFRERGFAAQDVSGRMTKQERQAILTRYESGEIQILCACDVLNEGWDAPHTEVLLMARPTLSKVIYQQQLGRGMRTYPGKETLVLFDFVDIFGRHNEALSIHRFLKRPEYRGGQKIFGTDDKGDAIELPLHLWVADYEEVNVFDWQERVEGLITAPALSRALRKTAEWASDKFQSGALKADEVIEMGGGRRIPYFDKERVPGIRQQFGLLDVTDDNLWQHFLADVQKLSMQFSYKPVFLLALLQSADATGKAEISKVAQVFQQFYLDKHNAGQPAESARSSMSAPHERTLSEIQHIINEGPFDKFERDGYVAYASDKAFFQVNKIIWAKLSQPENRQQVENFCQQNLAAYYQRLSQKLLGE